MQQQQQRITPVPPVPLPSGGFRTSTATPPSSSAASATAAPASASSPSAGGGELSLLEPEVQKLLSVLSQAFNSIVHTNSTVVSTAAALSHSVTRAHLWLALTRC